MRESHNRESAEKKQQKGPWRFWPFRISIIVGQPLLCGLLPIIIYYWSIGESVILILPLYFAIVILNSLVLLNWCVFPFDYSIMGKLEKTSKNRIAVLARIDSPVMVGSHFRSGFPAIWEFSDETIHLTIPLIGRVLIPVSTIDRMSKQHGGWFILVHHCKEIRSPMRIRSPVFEYLSRCASKCSSGKPA